MYPFRHGGFSVTRGGTLEMTSFVFKSGSGIELRFPVLDTHDPESDAKISLPSWASMI